MIKRLLLPVLFLGILLSFVSCGGDVAEDGSRRGALKFAGSVLKNGKEYYVFVYLYSETIDASDGPSVTFYEWITYTLDGQTGKVVHQTNYDLDDYAAGFLGISRDYTFFAGEKGIYAVDLHADNKTLEPDALKKMIATKNPALKGIIASLEVDSWKNLRVLTTTGDLYILNTTDLSAQLINDEIRNEEAYKLQFMSSLYGDIQSLGTYDTGYAISDTSTLVLTSQNPSNSHKKYLHIGNHTTRTAYFDMMKSFRMRQIGSEYFLDGNDFGMRGDVVYISFVTTLGKAGVEKICAYNWAEQRFLWSKPAKSLYVPQEGNDGYQVAWNYDGTAFFIWGYSNEYLPMNLIDGETGAVKWKF